MPDNRPQWEIEREKALQQRTPVVPPIAPWQQAQQAAQPKGQVADAATLLSRGIMPTIYQWGGVNTLSERQALINKHWPKDKPFPEGTQFKAPPTEPPVREAGSRIGILGAREFKSPFQYKDGKITYIPGTSGSYFSEAAANERRRAKGDIVDRYYPNSSNPVAIQQRMARETEAAVAEGRAAQQDLQEAQSAEGIYISLIKAGRIFLQAVLLAYSPDLSTADKARNYETNRIALENNAVQKLDAVKALRDQIQSDEVLFEKIVDIANTPKDEQYLIDLGIN